MKKEDVFYYYYDEDYRSKGEILEVAKNGIWGYGETFFRLYQNSKLCFHEECKDITDTRHFYIYKVKPLGKVYEGENCKLSTKIQIL